MPDVPHDLKLRSEVGPSERGQYERGPASRVVLVGRTGLDARLRTDQGLELIRARTGFDAIGELANPIGPVPGRTVVIVGAGADIDDQKGGVPGFSDAVQRVAPGAVIAASLGMGMNPHETAAYRITVEPTIRADELRRLLHGDTPSPPPLQPVLHASLGRAVQHAAPTAFPSAPSAVAPSKPAHQRPFGVSDRELAVLTEKPQSPSHAGALLSAQTLSPLDPAAESHIEPRATGGGLNADGDGALVACVLSGGDLTEAALAVLRSRTGRGDLAFVPLESDAPSEGTEVVLGDRLFGWLTSEQATGRGGLAEHARWLAGWLALGDHQRRMRIEALTDPVSGAWNRRYFDRFLAAAIPDARARRRKLTVLVFDLDNFKTFNDRFGHAAGDAILVETVRLLKSLTRSSDRICRIGGDEFAVIFHEPEGPRESQSDHPDDFQAVARRFQRAIVEQRFPKLGIEAPGELTISGGLATFPWDGQSAAELLQRADELAIASKRGGKNMITFGSPPTA
jgi:diguanylate cyclase (GGDEF)-like protein